MGMFLGWSWKRQGAPLSTSLIILAVGVTGFPAGLFAQPDGGQPELTREVGKAEMPKGKSIKTGRGNRTKGSADRKEIPLRIPARNAELLRLKSQPGVEHEGKPIVPPAR
jgi:hypothetical protein